VERLGSYRIAERLGSGGFSTVWKGLDDALGGPVAIKVLADNWAYDADVRERFIAEARSLWRISDPKIVRVFTLEDAEGKQPWFAMEYADRGSLGTRLSQVAPPSEVGEAAHLIHELASCVEAVHRNGLIHRDVKPDNFLILGDSTNEPRGWFAPDERVVISDLGQAKALAASSGFTRATGTPGWMAPEQAEFGHGLTPAADVFSLGVLARSILDAIDGLPFEQRAPIDNLIARATATEPQARPGSAIAFGDELVALASGTDTASSPPPMQPPTPASPPPTPPSPMQSSAPPSPPSSTSPVAIAEKASPVNLWLVAGGLGVAGIVLVIVAILLLGSGG